MASHRKENEGYSEKKNCLKSSVLQQVVALWSSKAKKAHFEKIKDKVFRATFKKKIFTP